MAQGVLYNFMSVILWACFLREGAPHYMEHSWTCGAFTHQGRNITLKCSAEESDSQNQAG